MRERGKEGRRREVLEAQYVFWGVNYRCRCALPLATSLNSFPASLPFPDGPRDSSLCVCVGGVGVCVRGCVGGWGGVIQELALIKRRNQRSEI